MTTAVATPNSQQEILTFDALKLKLETLIDLLSQGRRTALELSSETNRHVTNYIKSGKMTSEELLYIQEQNNRVLFLLEKQMEKLSSDRDDSAVVSNDTDKYTQLLKKFGG